MTQVASAFFWPLVVVVIVFGGYYANRKMILRMAEALSPDAHTPYDNLPVVAELPAPERYVTSLSHVDYTHDEGLEGDELDFSILALIEYAREFGPDFIMGVHPGGRLLSVIVSKAIHLSADRCLYASTHPTRNDEFVIEPDLSVVLRNLGVNRLEGKLLVVDDISRSGRTLRRLKTKLNDLNAHDELSLQTAVFAVLLVVSVQVKDALFRFSPDWAALRTERPNYKLPWSALSNSIQLAYDNRENGSKFDLNAIERHELLARSFEAAWMEAKKYLPKRLVDRILNTDTDAIPPVKGKA